MYREGKQILTSHVHNFILSHGALGDVITSLPAIIHARKTVSDLMAMKVYCPEHQIPLIEHLLAPYGKFILRPLTEFPKTRAMREGWDGGPTSMNAPPYDTHTRNRQHMVDFAFSYLIDAQPESMAERNYPNAAPLGPRTIAEKYVVFPIGATSENKLFRASVMGPIIEWVIEQGYVPVLLGSRESRTNAATLDGTIQKIVILEQTDLLKPETLALCVDLRDKTTLLEARDVLGYAEAVVGVDGGTLHLAGTTDTNIVYAMGTTLPKHRYIPRNANPNHKIRYVGPRDLECTGCQSNWQMTRWNFRYCIYEDNKCMEQLHPADFIAGLQELGL